MFLNLTSIAKIASKGPKSPKKRPQVWPGAFFVLFGPLGAIFGVKVKLINIFGTYLHRLTTFILEV